MFYVSISVSWVKTICWNRTEAGSWYVIPWYHNIIFSVIDMCKSINRYISTRKIIENKQFEISTMLWKYCRRQCSYVVFSIRGLAKRLRIYLVQRAVFVHAFDFRISSYVGNCWFSGYSKMMLYIKRNNWVRVRFAEFVFSYIGKRFLLFSS